MIFGGVSVDATQTVGIAGFGVAALLCARVAPKSSNVWWVLTATNVLLMLEIVAGWRFRVHDHAAALLLNQGLYESRMLWQVAMIAVALVVLLAAGLTLRARAQSASLASALTGLCSAISILVIEAISLHAVDAELYQALGPVKVIAFFWLAASTWISWAAIKAARR